MQENRSITPGLGAFRLTLQSRENGFCGYVYSEEQGDPDNGIAPGTKWEDVPDDFLCPVCGLGKDFFEEE